MKVDDNGVGYVTLKDGESITFNEIPHGASYTIEELDADDYTVTVKRDDGATGAQAQQGLVEGDAKIAITYTNDKPGDEPPTPPTPPEEPEKPIPYTGDETPLWPLATGALAAAVAAIVLIRLRAKRSL